MSPRKSHTRGASTSDAAKKSGKSNKIAPMLVAHETLAKEIVEEEEMKAMSEKDVKRNVPEFAAHRFEWKNGGNTVKLTGNFDNWEETIEMNRSPDNQGQFWVTLDLDRSKKNFFKFIVDGQWRCTDEFGTEYDGIGNLNNVLPPI
ncbi:hypothetical protein BGZ58_002296 [Dissophora ornata]|nr:hypothetical protein BGZ58_002296 [Dissophora ornata]